MNVWTAAAGTLALCMAMASTAQNSLRTLDQDTQTIIANAASSLVRVVVHNAEAPAIVLSEADSADTAVPAITRSKARMGSGFVADAPGWVLTGSSVVRGVRTCQVQTLDGQTWPAEVVSTDDFTSTALLRVTGQHTLKPVRIGDSSKLTPGSVLVFAGAGPGGRLATALGLVNNTGIAAVIGDDQIVFDLIEISTALPAGSTGGVIFNAAGEAVGMVVAQTIRGKESPSPAISGSLMVPIHVIKQVFEQMKQGALRRPWVGATFAAATDEESRNGVRIVSVQPDGPAAVAGIRPDDVIVRVNDVTVSRADEISLMLRRMQPGSAMSITVLREGQEVTCSVRLGIRGGSNR